MHQVIVCCIVFSVLGLCLAVYAKNAIFRIFPDIEKNKNMLGFGSEFLIYDKSVPRSTQRLFLAAQFVTFLGTVCGFISSVYYNNYGWIKVFALPTAFYLYIIIVHSYRFIKCKG